MGKLFFVFSSLAIIAAGCNQRIIRSSENRSASYQEARKSTLEQKAFPIGEEVEEESNPPVAEPPPIPEGGDPPPCEQCPPPPCQQCPPPSPEPTPDPGQDPPPTPEPTPEPTPDPGQDPPPPPPTPPPVVKRIQAPLYFGCNDHAYGYVGGSLQDAESVYLVIKGGDIATHISGDPVRAFPWTVLAQKRLSNAELQRMKTEKFLDTEMLIPNLHARADRHVITLCLDDSGCTGWGGINAILRYFHTFPMVISPFVHGGGWFRHPGAGEVRVREAGDAPEDHLKVYWSEDEDDPLCDQAIGSPLITDLSPDASGVALSAREVLFDLDGDGDMEVISWPEQPDLAPWLALDVNGNGSIDSGRELFGNYTMGKDGSTHQNGFDALATYDDNGDGFIDENDSIFASLLSWRDLDRDGSSQKGELISAASDLVRIDLGYSRLLYRDAHGNITNERTTVELRNSDRLTALMFDIWFETKPIPQDQ